jgi:predicted AAA+ superfamily ATPase
MYIHRSIESSIADSIKNYPVTAIIGPRQCGKSTLVKHLLEQPERECIYLDLERPSDLQKLENVQWFFSSQKEKLICIDEVQRRPDIFPVLRSLVDEWDRSGCFLILGSASRDLLKQSSESLAGRIVYKHLTPFLKSELGDSFAIERYLAAGGFPRSVLAAGEDFSFEWRKNFIATFLERDLLQWQYFSPVAMRRLWTMLAHYNGQTVNYSEFAKSLGISNQTVKNYIDLLDSTFMVEVIPPYLSNLGKRLVKSPKVYISDSGITAALLGLRSFDEISGHPAFGAIWEQIVLTNLKGLFPEAEFYFYRTAAGAEIDFVVHIRNKIFAIECKASYSPALSKGNYAAIEDIAPAHTFVVTPSSESWSVNKGIDVVSLHNLRLPVI